ncbi:MAG: valine--tRNA ligase [bacterium]
MKDLAKVFNPLEVEKDLYQQWESQGEFKPKDNKTGDYFSIVLPPPNATGILHLGHATMLAVEDIMVRYHRMKGDSTVWIPGTDHAAIATQSKVEELLYEQERKTRYDLGREKFLERVEEYIKNSQDTIRKQLRAMGASLDWSREKYTLEPSLVKAVQEMFVKMHNDGLIYRGERIVNWDPKLRTTVADDEMEHEEKEGVLYYIQYGPLVVATSRPETKLGDTAVAVNPNDDRWNPYIGKTIEVEFGRGHKITIPVIGDETVDPTFGSGCVGMTPAHSAVDFEMAERHGLAKPQVIDFNGKMTAMAGPYQGLDIFECRKQLVEDLRKEGKIVKEEKYQQAVAVNYRGSGVIEPQIMKQWFVSVDKPFKSKWGNKSLKEIAVEVVTDKEINIIPERFEKVYLHWMNNLHDWCISRQIWFGHRIPVWFNKQGEVKVQLDKPSGDWEQDPDTLDTWFSSGLWTWSTMLLPPKDKESLEDWIARSRKDGDLGKFHPTSVLETGYDILFFWIARMVLLAVYGVGEVPFKTVYLHGLVRDEQGKKMSKSLNNGIDPLDMIAKYGADATRLSLVLGSTPGNDIRLSETKVASYRNFVNKVWNIGRYILGKLEEPENNELTLADQWIMSRFQKVIINVTKSIEDYRFSDAGNGLYEFLWHELADWYLEITKVEGFKPKHGVLDYLLMESLKLLHPFVPFVTEHLWSLRPKTDGLLITHGWPDVNVEHVNEGVEKLFSQLQEMVVEIRNKKAEAKTVGVVAGSVQWNNPELVALLPVINKLCRVELTEGDVNGDSVLHLTGADILLSLVNKRDKNKDIKELVDYINKIKQKIKMMDKSGKVKLEVIAEEKEKLRKQENRLEKLQN